MASNGDGDVDDNDLGSRLAAELSSMAPVNFAAPAAAVFQLVALVQLALRHPGVTPALRQVGELFVQGTAQRFADCPVASALIQAGNDPAADVFRCPRCGTVSHNQNDLTHGYCGACHAFTGIRGG
jgi:hypothetical protein